MTNEEAIIHFKRVIGGLKYLDKFKDNTYLKEYIKIRNGKNRRRLQASRVAVSAIEKQIQKKPKGKLCPNCNNTLPYREGCNKPYPINYCWDCGQAFDWSDTE